MALSALRFHGLRALAIAGAFVYLGWNMCWWSLGHLAPALSLSLFGLPAPTTGMTRSLIALRQGHWLNSLQWNPFSLLFLIMFAVTIGLCIRQATAKQRIALPSPMVRGWLAILTIAWLVKLIQGPVWW